MYLRDIAIVFSFLTSSYLLLHDYVKSDEILNGIHFIKAISSAVPDSQLNCYPYIDENPKRGLKFTCGGKTYSVYSYKEEFSEEALGGQFPLTKTLIQLGCKTAGEYILCREERAWSARGSDLLAYREIVAKIEPN